MIPAEVAAPLGPAEVPAAVGAEPGRRSCRRVLRWWPLAVLAVAAFAAAFPFVLAPNLPDATDLVGRLKGPGTTVHGTSYLLGTDSLGRDVLSRVIWGTRISMTVAVIAVVAGGVVGSLLGILAGSRRKVLGGVIMRFADMVLSIPFFLLAILVVAILGPSLVNTVIVLATVRWPRYARVAFGQTLEAHSREFVKASVAVGVGPWRLFRRHILPEVLPSLIVVATLEVGLMIIYEAALSFIGLGAQPPTPSWGAMLSEGQQYVSTAWWIATFPGLALFVIVVSVNRLGDLLRDRLDPRQRSPR